MNIPYEVIKPFEPFGMPMASDVLDLNDTHAIINEKFKTTCAEHMFEVDDSLTRNSIKCITEMHMQSIGCADPYCFVISMRDQDGNTMGFIVHYSFRFMGSHRRYRGEARHYYQIRFAPK